MYKQIATNKRNTILIMIFFVALISIIGGIFAFSFHDAWIAAWVFFVSLSYTIIQYFASASLAVAMTGAKEIQKKDYPVYYNIVENLSLSAGLPMPKVCVIDDPAPNAFATGRDPKHSVVAVTTGLLDILNKSELEAVVAHELSHIKNYDIRVSMIAFGLVCVIGFIADLGLRMSYYGSDEDRSPVGSIMLLVTAIFAPLIASLAQFAVSREREYLADMSAVSITRYPEGMISALRKIAEHSRPMRRQNAAAESLYFANPLKKNSISRLFSTHPSFERRIERLENAKNNF